MAEPEWDQATRDLALGHAAVDLCGVCGGPAYLCQDAARQFDWRVGDPVRCHRTTALREKQKSVTEETNPHTEALLWPISLSEGRST